MWLSRRVIATFSKWNLSASCFACLLYTSNVYANGVGAEKFGGVFDNTEIFHKLADLTKVK